MSVVKINGITLSSILFEHLRADCDKEGLLLGTVTTVSSESISDAELGQTRTEQVVVTSYIPCEGLFSWYNSAGHVLTDKLNAVLSRNEHKEVLGWYKLRRQCSPVPSLRERLVHASLTREFSDVPAGCFLYLLCTTFSSGSHAAHSFDHLFLASPRNSNVLQAIHVEVVNLKDTNQSDYLRSSSNASSHGSYHDISNTHRSLFVSRDGALNTVQAVSHMSSDMCQRLQNLCKALTKSEDNIGKLRSSVDQLEVKISLARQKKIVAFKQAAEREHLAAAAAAASQQQPTVHHSSEPDVNLIDFDADVPSPVVQLADVIEMPPPSSQRQGSTSPEMDDRPPGDSAAATHARQQKKRRDKVLQASAEVDLIMMDSGSEENLNKKSSAALRDNMTAANAGASREYTTPPGSSVAKEYDALVGSATTGSSTAKEFAALVSSAAGSRDYIIPPSNPVVSHGSVLSYAPAPTPASPSLADARRIVATSNKPTATAPSTTGAIKFKKVTDTDAPSHTASGDNRRTAVGQNQSATSDSSNFKPTGVAKTYSDAMKDYESKRAASQGNGATATSSDASSKPASQHVMVLSTAPGSVARQSPLPQPVHSDSSHRTGSGEHISSGANVIRRTGGDVSPQPGSSSRLAEQHAQQHWQEDAIHGASQQRQQQPKAPSPAKTGSALDAAATVPATTAAFSGAGSQFDRTSTARIALVKSGSSKAATGVMRSKPVERSGGFVPKTVRNSESDDDTTDDGIIPDGPPSSSRKPSSKNRNSPHL